MQPKVLISDFDNTLYDWFAMWHASFTAMMDEIERIGGLPRETLYPEIRAIHQRHGTSEYAFLIEAMPSLRKKFPGQDLTAVFDPAIHAYRKARKATLRLYPGVRDTLNALLAKGVAVALYTDSLWFYTSSRIRALELDEFIDDIYSPPDHELPGAPGEVRRHPSGYYALKHARHRCLPEGLAKPQPELLLNIARELGFDRSECLYVGDSLMKDVAMAKECGIVDVWAEYGASAKPEEYELLKRVSHWPDADVRREEKTKPETVLPTHAIAQFGDLLEFFA
jgi:FMN phosphatase YigB (HAD superfamily)